MQMEILISESEIFSLTFKILIIKELNIEILTFKLLFSYLEFAEIFRNCVSC